MHSELSLKARWSSLGIVGGIAAITALHYSTSLHSVLLHEVFQRLYYLPIVAAGVMFGWRAALAASLLVTALYVPHIALNWHAWPVFQVDQYGEVLLFNLVGFVTGVLADRVRHERNRYRAAAIRLESAHAELLAHTEERIRMDRLVTIGRVASGIAHEIRNPLGSLLGCLEIVAPSSSESASSGRAEFLALARDEVARLETVVSDFLEFAHPAPPTGRPADLRDLVAAAVRLAKPNLARRGLEIDCVLGEVPLVVLDAEQVQRALVNMLLDPLAPSRRGGLSVRLQSTRNRARVEIEVAGVPDAERVAGELFEPFPDYGNGHGLSLAVARRLIENQGGAVSAESRGTTLLYTIEFPVSAAGLPLARRQATDAFPRAKTA